MPLISVIVLNYNGRRWLGPCLEALRAQAGAPPHEILVVDNGSSDGSPALVCEAAGPSGDSPVREYLVFLNNDTMVAPDWLARLHAAARAHPEFDLITSRLVFMDDPATIDSAGDGYLLAGGAFKIGHGQPADGHRTSGEVFGACGAAFMIRREVFQALGGFDVRLFMVYEDVDLSYRARLRGHRVWFAADAGVRHAGSASLGRLSENAVFYGQRNLEWVWTKNTPRYLLWRTLASHAVYSLAGLAYYARAGRLGAALRGKLAALAGLPAVLRARREVQARVVVNPPLPLEPRWLALKRSEKRRRRE